jgi:hypothetical protein
VTDFARLWFPQLSCVAVIAFGFAGYHGPARIMLVLLWVWVGFGVYRLWAEHKEHKAEMLRLDMELAASLNEARRAMYEAQGAARAQVEAAQRAMNEARRALNDEIR